MPVESPVGAAAELRFTGFDAWDSVWPDTLGSGATASFVVGVDQFLIDRGLDDDTMAILYPATPQPPAQDPAGILFQPRMNVFSGSSPEVYDLISTSAGHQLSRIVKTGATGGLVGFQQTFPVDRHELIMCVQPFTPDGAYCVPIVGCGTDPVLADATALEQGFLFASSSSHGFGECMYGEEFGPPNRIIVGFLGGPGGGYGPLPIDIEQPDDIVQLVRVIPHSVGAWIVYQYAGLNAEQPPPVMAMRIAVDGTVLLEATPLLDGSQFFVEPAVAAIGDHLMVAWVEAFDPNGDAYIMMRVFDDAGTQLTQNAYQSHAVNPRLSALGSPDGAHVLIGWSEQTGMDGAGEEEAYVARFSCGAGQM